MGFMSTYELISRSISTGRGDGANDWSGDRIDEEIPVANDGRSQTRTTFRYREAPEWKQAQYKRLAEWNDGVQDSDRPIHNWRVGKENDADLFTQHLELSMKESDEVKEIVNDMDFNQFGSYSTGQVTVAVCSMVSDKHTDEFDNRIILKDEFRELMEVNNMGSKEHRRIRQLIREKTGYFDTSI